MAQQFVLLKLMIITIKFKMEGDIMNKDYAVHPGTTIKYVLMSIGKNQKWLSEEMKMSKVVISELINQKRNVTPAIAIAFEKATSYPAETLIKLQAEYDLFQERIKEEKHLTQQYDAKVKYPNSSSELETKIFISDKSTLILAS